MTWRFSTFSTHFPSWLTVRLREWVCEKGVGKRAGLQRESVCIDVVNASSEPELNQWITSQFADQKENNHTHLKCQKLPKRKSPSWEREMAKHANETATERKRREEDQDPFVLFAILPCWHTQNSATVCECLACIFFLINLYANKWNA